MMVYAVPVILQLLLPYKLECITLMLFSSSMILYYQNFILLLLISLIVLVSDFCLIILEISPYVLQHIKPALQLDVQQLIVWYSMTQTCFSEQIKP
jgi:hypothetical protein